jgi:hypothetical protein
MSEGRDLASACGAQDSPEPECWQASCVRNQRIRILREDLLVVEASLIQKNRIWRQSVVGFDGRVIDLWNARIEDAIRSPRHQRPLVSEGIRNSRARRKVFWLNGHLARVGPQRIAFQVFRRNPEYRKK